MKRFRFLMLVLLIALAVVCFASCNLLGGGGKDDTDSGKNNGNNNSGECVHEYTDVVTEPTCTTGGYTTHTCSKCGDVKKDTEVAAKGHTYTDKVTAPTCSADGYTTHTCTACQSSYKDTYVTMLGHQYDYANATSNSVSCTSCTGGSSTYTWTPQSGFTYKFRSCTVNGKHGYRIEYFEGTLPSTLKLPAVYDGEPVLEIDAEAFSANRNNGAKNLNSVVVPDTVIKIGDYAFSGCEHLSEVTFPNTLQAIGANPLSGTYYEFSKTKKNSGMGPTTVAPFIVNNRYLLKPLLELYQEEYVVPEGITVIADNAFSGTNCASLETLTLPKSLIYLGKDALAFCSVLKTLNIYKGVQEFGYRPLGQNSRNYNFTVNFEGTKTEWQAIAGSTDFGYPNYIKYSQKIGG